MDNKYDRYKLEDFVLDPEFFHHARSKYKGIDLNSWDLLLRKFPEKRELMERAYRIINGIQIKEIKIKESKVRQDYILLERRIRQRKNKRIFYRIASAAACFLLLISGLYLFRLSENEVSDKNNMLTQWITADAESEDIQVIIGEERNSITGLNATIQEQEDGTLLINDKPFPSKQKEPDYIQLVVPKGKRSYVQLKDGSKIWVNSATKLIYPSQFDGTQREIYVNGEVYLEIAKDESRPFFVHTTHLDVKVLGTNFNVSAYADDPFTQVVLVTGSVEVKTNKKETTRLIPDMCYHLEDGTGVIRQVDAYKYICWKEGVMKLEGEELQDVFKRLSRYYNVRIISSPDINQVRYFGKLALEETIENVIYNISLVEPIEYKREGESLFIRQKKVINK